MINNEYTNMDSTDQQNIICTSFQHAYEFELSVTHYIKSCMDTAELRACNAERRRRDRYGYEPDMYLPIGCKKLGINGSAIIDFKFRIIRGIITRLQERMINFANANGINNIIIIYNYCNADDRQLIKGITVDNRIKFLNVSEIPYKCDDDLVNTPEDNDFDVFAEAKRACKNGGIVLFLGAGVSMSAGLPSWNDLLKKSLIDGLNAPEKDYRHIREHAYDSSIVAARYIKTIYNSNPKKDESGGIVEFNEIIRRNLYKNKKDSSLLDSICKLIKSKKIESIVTYNYDDLIEEKLASSDGPAILPISKSQDSYIQGTIPVFHVHGMLSSKEGVALDSDIILTEDEYHNIYKESYNWSTIVQLFALQYRTCFFIGLSMSDPNLRRLLDIAWNNSDKEKLKHYVFLQNEQNSIFPSPETQKIRKDIMNKFGINVVWFDSFDDLTTKIDELANFARQE